MSNQVAHVPENPAAETLTGQSTNNTQEHGWSLGCPVSMTSPCSPRRGWHCHIIDMPPRLLMAYLDPQYRVPFWTDDEDTDIQIDPDWDKIEEMAQAMANNTFDHAQAMQDNGAIHLLCSASGAVIENGNHRVLAADDASSSPAATIPVHVTVAPGGEDIFGHLGVVAATQTGNTPQAI
jgi:hypothetical protein